MQSRLDKVLSESNILSRSETKAACRKGRISVNGATVKNSDLKIDENDVISIDGKEILRRKYFYIMMNKPAGLVCSTEDAKEKTVLSLLSDEDNARGLFPAGRLDKDTVGLLLLTNDGQLAHDLLSPKKHVSKKYYFHCQNELSEKDIHTLQDGIIMDGEKTKPAEIEYSGKEGYITITEGKFHQIKRMFEYVDNKITYLKRVTFGPLALDISLNEGKYRFLTEAEITELHNSAVYCG